MGCGEKMHISVWCEIFLLHYLSWAKPVKRLFTWVSLPTNLEHTERNSVFLAYVTIDVDAVYTLVLDQTHCVLSVLWYTCVQICVRLESLLSFRLVFCKTANPQSAPGERLDPTPFSSASCFCSFCAPLLLLPLESFCEWLLLLHLQIFCCLFVFFFSIWRCFFWRNSWRNVSSTVELLLKQDGLDHHNSLLS